MNGGLVANDLQLCCSQCKQSEQLFASVADCSQLKVIDCIPVVQLFNNLYFSAGMTFEENSLRVACKLRPCELNEVDADALGRLFKSSIMRRRNVQPL